MYHTCRIVAATSSKNTATLPTTCGIIKITNPPISISCFGLQRGYLPEHCSSLILPWLLHPFAILAHPSMEQNHIGQFIRKLDFRHSCTFCTPHFFYINSNKPTADRTKAIHRRLELSCNLYSLLLFVGQNRASKSHLHITLRISRFLQFFNK